MTEQLLAGASGRHREVRRFVMNDLEVKYGDQLCSPTPAVALKRA